MRLILARIKDQKNSMTRIKISLLLFLVSYSLTAQNKKDSSFCFVAFGDMPYFLPADYLRFENVIRSVNNLKPAFSVNVGDIKASSTLCSEEVYSKMLNYYGQFNRPMIYTPGDNEWTDCTKKEAGAYDAEERLQVIRKMFFTKPSLGNGTLDLRSQSANKEFSKYVENNQWQYNNVAFATVHIVGSNNNFLVTSKNGNQEFYEREKAALAWLDEIFKNAKSQDNSAVVIVIHADMFLGAKDLREASGFNQIKKKLRELSKDFKKPVLLINGDSHVFIVDKPLYEDDKSKATIDNFTRVQVHGENSMHAVKIVVDPESVSVFQFEELKVTGN